MNNGFYPGRRELKAFYAAVLKLPWSAAEDIVKLALITLGNRIARRVRVDGSFDPEYDFTYRVGKACLREFQELGVVLRELAPMAARLDGSVFVDSLKFQDREEPFFSGEVPSKPKTQVKNNPVSSGPTTEHTSVDSDPAPVEPHSNPVEDFIVGVRKLGLESCNQENYGCVGCIARAFESYAKRFENSK